MAPYLIAGIVVVVIILNAWTTRFVLRDHLASPGQRVAQIAFVWLLPLFGALLTLHLKRMEPEPPSGHYAETPHLGDDFGVSGTRFRDHQNNVEFGDSGGCDGGSSD